MKQEVKLLLLFFLSSVPPERAAGVSAVAAARVSSSETFSWCDHQGYQSRTLNNVCVCVCGRRGGGFLMMDTSRLQVAVQCHQPAVACCLINSSDEV